LRRWIRLSMLFFSPASGMAGREATRDLHCAE
jgi:hypothetical protein